MYFGAFNTITYSGVDVTDISNRISLIDAVKNNNFLSFEYYIDNGESPEAIAYNFYGDASLHWIILLMNNIYDPMYEWCLDTGEMLLYLIDKYGDLDSDGGGYGGIHHWEFAGMILDEIKELTSVSISDGGSGFKVGDLLITRHKSLKSAEFIVTIVDGNGTITSIEITNGGGFTSNPDTNFKLYGGNGVDAIMDGVYSIPSSAVAVSNRQYEDGLNEKRRKIKVLHPESITQIKQELEYLLSTNGFS